MNTASLFQLSSADLAQLQPYLQHDPNDITKGIPEVIIFECVEFLDILSDVRYDLDPVVLRPLIKSVIKKVWEKALRMILNRPIVFYPEEVIKAGTDALLRAYDDLDESTKEDLSEEARLALIDWDDGMIACAIIKACGRAAEQELVST